MRLTRTPRVSGITLSELLIAMVVGVLLVSLISLCFQTSAAVKAEQTQVLRNMKQLWQLTDRMARDGESSAKTGWPGDLPGGFSSWSRDLVAGGYTTTNDLCRLLSSELRVTPPTHLPTENVNAVLVYEVKKNSDGATLFLSSANFTNTPQGGIPPLDQAQPFGQDGFVVFHRRGDGTILRNALVGEKNWVGLYAPPCD